MDTALLMLPSKLAITISRRSSRKTYVHTLATWPTKRPAVEEKLRAVAWSSCTPPVTTAHAYRNYSSITRQRNGCCDVHHSQLRARLGIPDMMELQVECPYRWDTNIKPVSDVTAPHAYVAVTQSPSCSTWDCEPRPGQQSRPPSRNTCWHTCGTLGGCSPTVNSHSEAWCGRWRSACRWHG